MEVTPRESSEQLCHGNQEIEETPKKTESAIEKNSKDRDVESARCFSRHDFLLNPTWCGRGREAIRNNETEMILLQHRLTRDYRENTANRQVIELSDNDSKLTLRRQVEITGIERRNSDSRYENITDHENVEILRKLPADTVVIRQRTLSSREDSETKEERTNNNSESGSSTGCVATKMKRTVPSARIKTHEMEVRRNPVRISKKNMDKDFLRPSQRLLRKKEISSNYVVSNKRSKAVTMPYMNTRSATRKMYTVGATYQAPTKEDEIVWKEWPVHGMHERPVYHPRVGLAVKYLEKYYTSVNGLSYSEIIDEPEIEVVAVDPHCDQQPSSPKKKSGNAKMKNKSSSNSKNALSRYLSKNESFETCMHGSLHCVLGYCSQVMTPYNKRVPESKKMTKPTIPAAEISISEMKKNTSMNFMDSVASSSKTDDKYDEETKLLEGYAIAMAQSAQNKSTMNNTNDRKTATTASSSARRIPDLIKIGSSKITARNSKMNVMNTFQSFPSNSMVLLKNSNAKMIGKTCTSKNAFDAVKLASFNEEILSTYKKLISTNEPILNREESSVKDDFHTLKRCAMSTQEFSGAKKINLDGQLEKTRTIQITKENNENENADDMKIKQSKGRMSMKSPSKTPAWHSETSEIAKILSEYNKSTTRKSAIQTYTVKAPRLNIINLNTKDLTRTTFPQKEVTEENRDLMSDKSVTFNFSQAEWQKLALQRPMFTQVNNNVKNSIPAFMKSHQPLKTLPSSNTKDVTKAIFPWQKEATEEENRNVITDRSVALDFSKANWQKLDIKKANFILDGNVISIPCKEPSRQQEIVTIDAKSKESTSRLSKNETDTLKTEKSLQELLENTAILYCAANGVHQDDLSSYIDTLDSEQSIQWLENLNNSVA